MKQESIHPRSYYPREESRKRDTKRHKDKNVTRRKIAAIEGHLERHPRDTASQRHMATLQSTL